MHESSSVGLVTGGLPIFAVREIRIAGLKDYDLKPYVLLLAVWHFTRKVIGLSQKVYATLSPKPYSNGDLYRTLGCCHTSLANLAQVFPSLTTKRI